MPVARLRGLMNVDDGASSRDSMLNELRAAVPAKHVEGVKSSLAYVRDRVGVPRDPPLAAARYFRAYLNWGIDSLLKLVNTKIAYGTWSSPRRSEYSGLV
jgi:hypothetical protein